MNTSINLDFFLSAKSEKAKEKIVKKIKKALDDEFKENVVQREECRFQAIICYESWESSVYKTLQLCQSIGMQWILTGDINFEFSAWTNHPKIIGIESISVSIDNPMTIETAP